MAISGVSEETSHKSFLHALKCHMGKIYLMYSFLDMFECLIPLLGQDLLTKLNVQVSFSTERVDIKIFPY